jgi:hypothetical protein
MVSWLYHRWVTATLWIAILLLFLLPGLHWSWFLALIYLHTPIYMLHQVEEHTGDRFRRFVNQHVFGGLEGLTPAAVLWINIPGVWGVTSLSLYLAVFVGAGWGLIADWLVVVNGAIHIVAAIAQRSYNPGLWTAIFLFLPLSCVTLWKSAGVHATWIQHIAGLSVAVIIHAVIIVHTERRAARLRAAHS